jgi:hypothetical protein
MKNIRRNISTPTLLTVLRTAGALVLIGLVPASLSYADVQITIQNGRVSLVAKDATVSQILAEWSRVGQTKIVNAERVPGGPITIELSNVPEEQALDVLLRSVSGYVAAPRSQDVANLSRFDRIIVMPTSTPPRTAAVSPTPAAAFTPQTFTPPAAPAAPGANDDDDERAPGQRPPVFNPFPQPQGVNPQGGAPTTVPGVVNPGAAPNQMPVTVSTPGAQPPAQAPGAGTYSGVPTTPYGGVAVPGMIAPPPPGTAQPGQVAPGQQPQPQQPRRPEGGE